MDDTATMDLGEPFSSGPRRRGVARCPTTTRRRAGQAPTLAVKAELIRHLRRGLRREFAEALGVLQAEIEVVREPIDTAIYRQTLARIDGARALLDSIGLSDAADARDVEIDIERWRAVVLKVLGEEYEYEVSRLEDAARDGFPNLARHDVYGLAELLAQLRETSALASAERAVVDRPRRLRGSPT
jgi:hypothetical protein